MVADVERLLGRVAEEVRRAPCAPGDTCVAYLHDDEGTLSRVVYPRPRNADAVEAVAAVLVSATREGGDAVVLVHPEPDGTAATFDVHLIGPEGILSARRRIAMMAFQRDMNGPPDFR